MKKIVCILMAALLLSGSVCYASETEVKETIATEYFYEDMLLPIEESEESLPTSAGVTPEVKAKSALLLEAGTGKVLYEKNAHEKLAPASITKIMSLLLVMEALDKGKLTMETEISASEHACSMGGSQIWLEPNETMTVHELLKAAVIASANDATVALGEAVAGSEEGFVAKMNQRAAELGMKDTHFVNATGLDAEGHLTSAYDVALMSQALIRHETIFQYSTVWMDTLRNGEMSLVNTNKLVRYYEGCKGLKTGTTGTAGHCLSAVAEKNGMMMVAVVMGAENSNDRFLGARKLLDYGFANYTFTEVEVPKKQLKNIQVQKGMEETVGVTAAGTKKMLTENSAEGEITVETEMEKKLTAPVEKGQQVGIARIMQGGKELGSIKLVAADGVKKKSLWLVFSQILQLICLG
ncbi:MAG: D-alanyl-D-alanine carboxypeptidase [Clostridia bacterium]|nr:D-alanyl-D-alanine carboxypeptidase [Clostridia bacterium]